MRSSSCDYYASTDSGYVKYENVQVRGNPSNKTIPVYRRCNQIMPYQVHPIRFLQAKQIQKDKIPPLEFVESVEPIKQITEKPVFSLSLFDYPKQLLDKYEVNSVHLQQRIAESSRIKQPSTPQNGRELTTSPSRILKTVDLTQSAVTNATKAYHKINSYSIAMPNTDRYQKGHETTKKSSLDLTERTYHNFSREEDNQKSYSNSHDGFLIQQMQYERRMRENLEEKYNQLIKLIAKSNIQQIEEQQFVIGSQRLVGKLQNNQSLSERADKTTVYKRGKKDKNHGKTIHNERLHSEQRHCINDQYQESQSFCTEPEFGLKESKQLYTQNKKTTKRYQNKKKPFMGQSEGRVIIPLYQKNKEIQNLQISDSLSKSSQRIEHDQALYNQHLSLSYGELQQDVRILGEGILDLECRLDEQDQRHHRQKLQDELKRQEKKVEQMQEQNRRLKLVIDINASALNVNKINSDSQVPYALQFPGNMNSYVPFATSFLFALLVAMLLFNLNKAIVC